jgi:hypothetical protein
MDSAQIVAGARVAIHPWVDPQRDYSLGAYVIFVRENEGQCVYVLYLDYDENIMEMSREAVDIRITRFAEIIRYSWLRAYVTALDVGSEELQRMVKAILPISVLDRRYRDEDDAEILAIIGPELLRVAVTSGKYRAVQWLLAKGVDPNRKNSSNAPSLLTAWSFGRLDICKLLLEHRADPNVAIEVVSDMDQDASKILLLYGGKPEFYRAILYWQATVVLTRALCSGAPISRLPTDILRTYLLPLIAE